MNPSAMMNPLKLIILLTALGLTACDVAPNVPAERPPLEGAAIGGPFELTGSDGKPVRWSDFSGQYRIIYFGFAYCPDICPTDMARITAALDIYTRDHPAQGENIQPIFITIDPERDTPEVVGEFTSAFSDRIVGLTGSPEQIAAAADAFGVFYARGEDEAGGGYNMEHSAVTYLFDPDGKPLATLPTDQGPDAVAAELAKWVR